MSRTHRVYAVDTIGDAGRSVNDGRPVDSLAGFMDWLDVLFDALDLDSASLCGHSYGAWLALNYALHAPQRVLKYLGREFPSARIVMPRRPAPDRLRASTVPTLLLLAEKSRVHDIHKVSANARKLMPHVVRARGIKSQAGDTDYAHQRSDQLTTL